MSRPRPLFSLRSDKGEVTAISFFRRSGSDRVDLITGHITGDIQLWNLQTNRTEIAWSAHGTSRVKWIGTADDKIFSFGRDYKLSVWHATAEGAENNGFLLVDCDTHCPCSITNVGAKAVLAIPQNNDSVHLVDAGDFSNIGKATPGNQFPKCGMTMSVKLVNVESTSLLLVAYESGLLAAYHLQSDAQSLISQLSLHSQPLTCLDFHPETMRGISGSVDTKLITWQMDPSDFRLSMAKSVDITNPGVQCVAIHPAGVYVAVGSWDSRIRLFSWKSLKPLAVIDFHVGVVQDMAFCRMTQTSVLLAAASKDGKVSVWDLYSDAQLKTKLL